MNENSATAARSPKYFAIRSAPKLWRDEDVAMSTVKEGPFTTWAQAHASKLAMIADDLIAAKGGPGSRALLNTYTEAVRDDLEETHEVTFEGDEPSEGWNGETADLRYRVVCW